jgi:hypothetical protein
MPAGFKYPPELPEGVAELFLLTKYHVDYAASRYDKGARVRGTDGYKIFTADGAAQSAVVPADWTLEQWRELLGQLLDMDLRWKNGTVYELFTDHQRYNKE